MDQGVMTLEEKGLYTHTEKKHLIMSLIWHE